MRRVGLAMAVAIAIAASYGLGRLQRHVNTAGNSGPHIIYYVDPMHPQYRSDKPGIAPDCGMPLKPVFADDAGKTASFSAPAPASAGAIRVDGAMQRLLGVRVTPVERSGDVRVVRAVGRVTPEDTRVYSINSGVDGFIRETYEDSVGTFVKRNQKLATYYSPDFLAVASGFLAASERVPGAVGSDGNRTVPHPGAVSAQGSSSIQGYADRLRNLGMSDVQIQQVAENRRLPQDIDAVAPVDGFILTRNISAGQHFERHMEFYSIADLSRVWVLAEVYEQDSALLHPGTPANVILNNGGRQLPARVTGSLPQSIKGGGTVKLRLEVENPNFQLRPEMLVDVELPVRLPPAVTVPVDALVDSGSGARVYVERSDGTFEARPVVTGWRSGERVQIVHGVEPGERVVGAAAFLVDSESRLKTVFNSGPQLSQTGRVDGTNP